jgi:hypothetical protein
VETADADDPVTEVVDLVRGDVEHIEALGVVGEEPPDAAASPIAPWIGARLGMNTISGCISARAASTSPRLKASTTRVASATLSLASRAAS